MQYRYCCSSRCGSGLLQPRLGHVHVLSLPSGRHPRRYPHRLPSASSCQSHSPSHHCHMPGHQCSSCRLWLCHRHGLLPHSGNLCYKGKDLDAGKVHGLPCIALSVSAIMPTVCQHELPVCFGMLASVPCLVIRSRRCAHCIYRQSQMLALKQTSYRNH